MRAACCAQPRCSGRPTVACAAKTDRSPVHYAARALRSEAQRTCAALHCRCTCSALRGTATARLGSSDGSHAGVYVVRAQLR
jgi:hypothetical protein